MVQLEAKPAQLRLKKWIFENLVLHVTNPLTAEWGCVRMTIVPRVNTALANPHEGHNYDSFNNIYEFCVCPVLEETEYTPLQHFQALPWASDELVKALFILW